MTAKRVLFGTLIWGLIFAAAGGLIGAAIGTFAPGYYRAVFRAERSGGFSPVQVGVGLGVTQGAGAGLAMAFATYAYFAWRDQRAANDADNEANDAQ